MEHSAACGCAAPTEEQQIRSCEAGDLSRAGPGQHQRPRRAGPNTNTGPRPGRAQNTGTRPGRAQNTGTRPGRAQNTGTRPGWAHNASTRPGRRHSSWRAERRDAVQRPRRVSFPGPGLTNARPAGIGSGETTLCQPGLQNSPATAPLLGATTPRGPASRSSSATAQLLGAATLCRPGLTTLRPQHNILVRQHPAARPHQALHTDSTPL